MLTGQDTETGLVQALEAGADEYITKPFKNAELRARVKVGARVAGLQMALSGRVRELEGALTARKRVEEELRKNEERFRLFFATIPDPVWGFDTETLRILEVNDAAVNHYGFGRDEFLNMKVTDIWEGAPPEMSNRREVSTYTELTDLQARHRTKDGRIVDVEVRWGRLDFGDRRTSLVSVHDITEKKRLELELRHSQKLEAVGTLAAGIAHEINTPIQFVGDNTHFLNESFSALLKLHAKYQKIYDDSAGAALPELRRELRQAEEEADLAYLFEEVPKALKQTMGGVEHVARIVRAMKEFAHPDTESKTACDINSALESVLVVARSEFKFVADVETNFGDIPLVVCQISEINQVFLNLLVNAAHAISDFVKGTELRGLIKVRTQKDDGHVLVAVEDTGGGIPLTIRDRIFEPFFTTKEVGRGTGQGLAISRSVVVDKHGGALYFETELGRGTTFYVRLPIDGLRRPQDEG
jgi:PAS domain S-box-containing protein